MLRERIDDAAFLNLIRKWLKAGILDTDGKVIDPETGTPQGGTVSPALANVYLHFVLDLWFQKRVKAYCKGDAFILRYADDFICAFRYRDEAERFYQALPDRLSKFNLVVAPEKTKIIRFSRFHPGMQSRIDFLGFETFWMKDSDGVARVKQRTARKKLQSACRRIKEWIKTNPSFEGQGFHRSAESKVAGALQLLQHSWQLIIIGTLLQLGDKVFI
jgi:RNA-directed DNA polymerase